jgi:hypothetical protein
MQSFRKVCRFLHREIGYVVVGLTVAYAISGIAVNHIEDWNPNYRQELSAARIQPVPPGETADVAAAVIEQLELAERVKNTWQPAPERLFIYLETETIEVDLRTGNVVRRKLLERPVLYDLNFLHLNSGKGIWTVVADVYAAALIVLALTGIFLTRGRKGLAGRGGVLLALGVALPVVYLVVRRYL